ncbi:MAG: anaerobic ribonucleoside-triphosphate reductase activating protein, partial [Firmicutes bacterium]|nr:anaerobic ribonucleoside-triphosphate reductase activating protein [Bacillota bacterium]
RSMSIIKLSGIDYEFRTTIVKGLHELSDMDSLGQLVRGAKRYFLQNFTDSGAILEGKWGSWDKDTLLAMLEVIKKYVPNAELRGVD